MPYMSIVLMQGTYIVYLCFILRNKITSRWLKPSRFQSKCEVCDIKLLQVSLKGLVYDPILSRTCVLLHFLKVLFLYKGRNLQNGLQEKTNSPKIALVIPFKKGYNPLLKPVAGYA